MYETISQFYPLPPLAPEDSAAPSLTSAADEDKAKSNPPYDTSAGKATPFVTLPYLICLYTLAVDEIVLPGVVVTEPVASLLEPEGISVEELGDRETSK